MCDLAHMPLLVSAVSALSCIMKALPSGMDITELSRHQLKLRRATAVQRQSGMQATKCSFLKKCRNVTQSPWCFEVADPCCLEPSLRRLSWQGMESLTAV